MYFTKMNGAGNDFVVLDARRETFALSPAQIRAIADRANPQTGGCDQLIVLKSSGKANIFMQIYNADGSEVSACGNATRCVAWLLMEENKTDKAVIETKAGILHCERAGDLRVTVDMGAPRLANAEIPLAEGIARDPLPLEYGSLKNGIAVGMGNPHAVFFVEDTSTKDLDEYGPVIEHRTDIFPERTNVEAAQIVDREHIILRVWERSAGFTQACGTGACATLVAANLRNLTGRSAEVRMPGGSLQIDWREDGHVWMTGEVQLEGEGEIRLA